MGWFMTFLSSPRSVNVRKSGVLFLLAAVFCSVVAVAPRVAHACSCLGSALSEYADEVVLAFEGHQLDRIVEGSEVLLVFRVGWVYKGRSGSRVTVGTGFGGGDCGLDLSGEERSGIVAFDDGNGGLTVNICTSPVSLGELEDVFGAGHPPESPHSAPESEAPGLQESSGESLPPEPTAALQEDVFGAGHPPESAHSAPESEAPGLQESSGEGFPPDRVAALQEEMFSLRADVSSLRDTVSTMARILMVSGAIVVVALVVAIRRRRRDSG